MVLIVMVPTSKADTSLAPVWQPELEADAHVAHVYAVPVQDRGVPTDFYLVILAATDIRLCLWSVQFLPQDKVVMFARLSPTELLKETEKAIGSGELFDLHKQLTAKKA